MDKLLKRILHYQLPVYFISPHLDDAVFSAGALISRLVKSSIHVSVINVFTQTTNLPMTLSAKAYLKQCRFASADSLFSSRITEDHRVLSSLGISPANLNYADALWRVRNTTLSKIVPELGAVYPTYRWHIAKGQPAASDAPLMSRLFQDLKDIIPVRALVFVPLAVGNHVDHVIVRNVSKNLPNHVLYWADFPYVQRFPLPEDFISQNGLTPIDYSSGLSEKIKLISGYKSQWQAMFPRGISHLPHETYFLSSI